MTSRVKCDLVAWAAAAMVLWGQSSGALASEARSQAECDRYQASAGAGVLGRLASGGYRISVDQKDAGILEVTVSSPDAPGWLVLMGTDHISPPNPPLFAYFDDVFRSHSPGSAYIEVSDTAYLQALPTDRDEVIRTRGEPSYLGFIARERQVPVHPLEPTPAALRSGAREVFTADQIAIAHILREVQILRDRRRASNEALEAAAARAIRTEVELARSAGQTLSFSNPLEFLQAVARIWPELDWRQTPAEWSNPTLEAAGTGSVFMNDLFRLESRLRDEHALSLLLSRVAEGERALALIGRTHVESHLEVLACALPLVRTPAA